MTAAFKRARYVAIKVQVHCENLCYDVEDFSLLTRLCCKSLESGVSRDSLFSILDTSSCLKELLQTCFGSYLILVLFRIVVWSVVFND